MPLAYRLPRSLDFLMVTWEGLEPPTLWFVGIARAFDTHSFCNKIKVAVQSKTNVDEYDEHDP